MRKEFLRYIIIQVIIILFIIPAAAAEKMQVAVLDLKADGVPVKTARTVSNIIRSELVDAGKFTVVERTQMDVILKEQGFQMTGCTDNECAIQIGKMISASKMLVGEVSPIGRSIIITVRIVDVERGVSQFSAKEKSHSENELDATVEKLTRKLVAKIEEGQKRPGIGYDISKSGYYLRGLVPGWAQVYSGYRGKGYVFMGVFLVSGIAATVARFDYVNKKNDYNDLGIGTTQDEYRAKYDDYDKAATLSNITIGLFLVQYVVNFADLFFISKPNFTAYSYGPVYEKEQCTLAMDYSTDIQGDRVTRVSCRFHF